MHRKPVHIIDDDQAIIQSISFMLGSEDFKTTAHGSAEDFLQALPGLVPGCILLDLRLEGMSGLELQKQLIGVANAMPVVVMTGHGDVDSAVSAMKEGAIDFLQKPFSKAELITAIEAAHSQLVQTDHAVQGKAKAESLITSLSPREKEVLEGLACGQPNKNIAYNLGISPRTVEIHRANAMRKLEAKSLPDMLHVAFLAGVMDK